jgi:hypothetical protein
VQEDHHAERWKIQIDAVRAPVVGHSHRSGVNGAKVALPTPPIHLGVCVQELVPTPGTGHTDPITVTWDRCQIEGNENGLPSGRPSKVGNNTVG